MNWFKVTIHHPPVAGEAVSAVLFEEGASGVWEDQPDDRGRQVTRAGFPQETASRLETHLPKIMGRLVTIFESSPDDFELIMAMEKNHDWAEKWKEGLSPITVNNKLAIAPTWWPDNDLPKAESILRIDPGLAFGSGHHASTFMCLSLLCEEAPGAKRILDVGAGSGILSLAAAVLSPSAEIFGVDNDLDTIAVAAENAGDNHLSGRIDFSGRELASFQTGFDLIVANITLGPLKELAPEISRLAEDGTGLILSGLLETQVEEISRLYADLGWGLKRHLGRDEWAGLLFVKGSGKADVRRAEMLDSESLPPADSDQESSKSRQSNASTGALQ